MEGEPNPPGAGRAVGAEPCPYGPEYQPFWDMRYRILRRFDEARVDATALYTMVPEHLALDMAARVGGARSLDLCCGVGAMSMALARTGQQVTAVDLDAGRIEMARHNARIYGVSDRIDFRVGDVTAKETLRSLPAGIHSLFLDPPWGNGPGDYLKRQQTRLADLQLAGTDLRRLVEQIACEEVMMRLPPNFDVAIFRDSGGEKLAYVSSRGYLHWYCVRLPRADFLGLPDRGAFPHLSVEARQGFVAVAASR
jgi:trimethylguanosine synthase